MMRARVVCAAALLLTVLLYGCFVDCVWDPNWGHPLTITVESVPSGADAYGVRGKSLGTPLGKTPLILTYSHGEWYPEGPAAPEVLEAVTEKTTRHTDTYYYFNCMLMKDGFEVYRMHEVIDGPYPSSDLAVSLMYIRLEGRHRTYRATLKPLVGESAPPYAQRE